ncbi:probable sodium/potassium-transporting ATPase subunit beta-3 [Ostrinia nubilalis]|uniref:probable sodium/potassium-transporting ATPase subunit beta-3 n=1 Tax=Ostrinia nubilalis TaxID=29057 RepID=UPI0030825CB5
MAPKRNKKFAQKKQSDAPNAPATRDPTVPVAVPAPTTSKDLAPPQPPPQLLAKIEPQEESCGSRCLKYLYNREKQTFCDRTCKSWIYIVAYSIMYLIFLTTYMLVFLYATLMILKHTDFKNVDKINLLTYSEYGIGLTATPTSESSYPLIWYRSHESGDYEKYVKSIDKLFLSRKTRDVQSSLGQCGQSPYGYGSAPCVIVRINKQLKWTGKALNPNSTLAANAPKEVQDWLKSEKRMMWLHCRGYHPYDREHIGSIRYFPYPPGFDPALFPLDVRNDPPLVAVQILNVEHGVSLAVECKLWHEHGPSSVEFVLYVEQEQNKTHLRSSDIRK